MLCTVCSKEIAEGVAFCSQCGAPTAKQPKVAAPQSATDKLRAAQAASAASGDPETELWHGGYSPKAMYGSWFIAAAATVAAIVVSALLPTPVTWLAAAVVVAGLWGYLLLYYLVARLSVDYTLTSQRLVHKVGLLRQITNRIEVIDIDDVTFVQGLFERMFGVGTIKLLSSDTSDPTLMLKGIDNVQVVAGLIDNARRDERRKRGLYMETV